MTDEPTIFAPASGFGRAAIAVIRLSGTRAGACLDGLTARPRPGPRRLVLRDLRDPLTGEILDRALVVWFPGPDTFTGEDQAELHLHGGLAVRAAVLRALATLPGCRPAEAGEFTRRAFMAGRMDLTEVEGLADLIDAETEAQRRQALRQLDGVLGRRVSEWRHTLLALNARTEAALDFADEDDVDADALALAVRTGATTLAEDMHTVLREARRGERLRDGFTVVLAGAPNAGKSTLLNALAQRDVAIVSPIPGTTRDAIEVRLDLGGLPVVLVDTAGLRENAEAVEAEGIARSRSRMAQGDLVLWLMEPDGEHPPPEFAGTAMTVLTKADLRAPLPGSVLATSAASGQGLGELLAAITSAADEALGNGGDALVTRERQRLALERCVAALDRIDALEGMPLELVAEEFRTAQQALGEIAGRVGVEEMLDHLFAGFCIGK